MNLYKTVARLTVLYGYEMWSKMRFNDVSVLSRFQHFIVEHILNLPTLPRSDMCQCILGIYTIEMYIHKRKLMFFQKLCIIYQNLYSWQDFFCFLNGNKHRHLGFIPDIVEILSKYDLTQYLLDNIADGHFPCKAIWKSLVQNAVKNKKQSS